MLIASTVLAQPSSNFIDKLNELLNTNANQYAVDEFKKNLVGRWGTKNQCESIEPWSEEVGLFFTIDQNNNLSSVYIDIYEGKKTTIFTNKFTKIYPAKENDRFNLVGNFTFLLNNKSSERFSTLQYSQIPYKHYNIIYQQDDETILVRDRVILKTNQPVPDIHECDQFPWVRKRAELREEARVKKARERWQK